MTELKVKYYKEYISVKHDNTYLLRWNENVKKRVSKEKTYLADTLFIDG